MVLLSKLDPGTKRKADGNCTMYLGLASVLGLIHIFFTHYGFNSSVEPKLSFVKSGSQFIIDGRPFYVNGWNSYWLMDQAVEEKSRPRVTEMFKAGAKLGLTVCRTWAFNDGTYHALQVLLGRYDELVFQDATLFELSWKWICMIFVKYTMEREVVPKLETKGSELPAAQKTIIYMSELGEGSGAWMQQYYG